MLMPCLKIPSFFLSVFIAVVLTCATSWGGAVSEVTVDAVNHQGSFVPANLVDGDPATAWVGGGKGIGPGKWIEFTFPADVKLQSLSIANGHQGKGKFKKFRRLTKGVILYPDGTRQKFVLKPSAGTQKLPLQPKTVKSIKIVITGVAPGSKDKAMGKAKVAVSEITVFGEMAEPAKEQEKPEPEEVVVTEGVEPAPKAAKPTKPEQTASEPVKAAKPESKSEPKPEPKPASKPAPKPKPVKVEKKVEAKPEKKSAPPKPKAKQTKPAPKKPVAKAKPKKVVSPAPKGSITHLRPSTGVPIDKPLDIGVINPWLDLEFVAQIKRYFALLTTLHDSYPDVFVASIRDRERTAFIRLQDEMRAKKQFGRHHIAMLEHIGLNFDKPAVNGDSATVRVHGPYRYYIENQAYEFQVDSVFTFAKENGKWLISNVQDK